MKNLNSFIRINEATGIWFLLERDCFRSPSGSIFKRPTRTKSSYRLRRTAVTPHISSCVRRPRSILITKQEKKKVRVVASLVPKRFSFVGTRIHGALNRCELRWISIAPEIRIGRQRLSPRIPVQLCSSGTVKVGISGTVAICCKFWWTTVEWGGARRRGL